MPLTITGATASWTLAPQLAPPTAAQTAGTGGPTQPHATSLVLVATTTAWNLALIVPTTAQLNPTAGPAQPYAASLVLVATTTAWNITTRIVQPGILAQRGTGGPTQPHAEGLIITGSSTTWNLAARLFAARFTFTIAPDGFTVLFQSTTGDTPDTLAWDYGDGDAGAGTNPVHTYRAIQPYTVTLTATRTRGFETAPLVTKASRVVTIQATAQPDESLDDVLNLEVGYHAYEPVRDQASDVGENTSFYNAIVNLSPGHAASLLFYAPARTIRVRQVTATGTGDALFKLFLNGQVIDAKRSYATQRNIRFDIEEGVKLTINDALEIHVTNTSTASQSYEAALLGRSV